MAQTKSRNTYSLAQTVRPRAGILNSGTSWCSCDFCSEPFLKCNAYNFIFSLGNIDLTAVCTKKPCTASCWFPCHAPARLGLRRAQRRRLAVPRKLTVLCFGGGRKPPPFPPDVHPGTFRGKGSQAEVPNPGPGPKAWARARETQVSIRYLRIEPRMRERWTLASFLTHSIEAGAYPSRHCTPFHRGSVLSAGRIRHHNGRTAASRDSGKKSVSTHTGEWGSHRRRQTVPCAHRSHPC